MRYMNAQQSSVLEALTKEGANENDVDLSFKAKLKEAAEVA